MRPLVLFVDDNKTLTINASELLGELGFEVSAYSDAGEALEQADSLRSVACAVIDWELKRLSGQEFYERLTDKIGKVPVIFISGYEPERLLPDSATFLKKPFRISDLAEKIRSLIR